MSPATKTLSALPATRAAIMPTAATARTSRAGQRVGAERCARKTSTTSSALCTTPTSSGRSGTDQVLPARSAATRKILSPDPGRTRSSTSSE